MTPLRAAGGRARLLAAAALLVTGTLLAGVPVAVAHPGDTAIEVAPAEAEAGSTVAVSGEGFTAGTQVELVLRTAGGDEVLAGTAVDEEGHFATDVALDASLETRYYELSAVGPAENASQLVAVTAALDAGGADGSTGPGLLSLVLGGAGLLAVGLLAVMVVLARRRAPVRTSTG